MAPTTSKKSVDEIWRELNSKAAGAAQGRARATGIAGFGIPGVTSQTRILPAKQPLAAALQDVALTQDTNSKTTSHALHRYDPAQAGASAEELSAWMASSQRVVNSLSDPDRNTRRAGIQALVAKLNAGDAVTAKPAPQLLQALLCGPLLHPLVTMLADPVERCRALTLQLLTESTAIAPDISAAMPMLMPALAARMGHLPVVESSEEVRLQLVELVAAVITACDGRTLSQYLPELVAILCRCQEDSFHDIKKAGAAAIMALAAKAPAGSTEPHAEKLLQALLPNLGHQHSRVRLAIAQAVGAVVQAGVPAGLMQTLVAPGVRPLAFDRSAQVRETFITQLAAWMGYCSSGSGEAAVSATTAGPQQQQQQQQQQLEGAAAAHTHAPALLPLLLLGVSDAQPDIAAQALALAEGVGQLYATAAPPSTAPASRYEADQLIQGGASAMDVDTQTASPASGAGACSSSNRDGSRAGMTDGQSASPSPAAVAAAQLGHPFRGPPQNGCSVMVQQLLPGLLPPVLSDLKEWTVSQRCAAARLLHTCLALAGSASMQHLPLLLPALIAATGDEDADVARNIIASVRVLGAFVAPRRWLPLLVDQLASAGARGSNANKANALVVTSALLSAAASAGWMASGAGEGSEGQAPADVSYREPQQQQQQQEGPLLGPLVAALSSEELRATDHAGVRAQLLAAVWNLLRCGGPAAAGGGSGLLLYRVLLQLRSAAQRAGESTSSVDAAFGSLAAACGLSGSAGDQGSSASGSCGAGVLSERFGAEALAAAAASSSEWSATSPAWLEFCALLQTASPAALQQLVPAAAAALQPLLSDPESDPALRLEALRLLDAVLEDEQRGQSLGGANAALTLDVLLLPPLVWRAGKVAAAVRFAAVTALATLLRRRLAPRDVLLAACGSGAAPGGVAAGPGAAGVPVAQASGSGNGVGVGAGGGQLLPLALQCLDEDWYPDLRLAACVVVRELLGAVGDALNDMQRRAVYPELLKRLDDSNNQVRVGACGALRAFVESAGTSYCDTNSSYLAAGVVIHMDDSDPAVQEAACTVLEAMARTKPAVATAEVIKVRDAFRSKHYIDRVLAVCGGIAT